MGHLKILTTTLILALSLLAFNASLTAQCELQRIWTITDLAPELARYWVDVERVDFNNDIAIFTRRERNDCKIMSCPPYDVFGDRLVFRYSLTDTLSVRIRERSCRRLEAYAGESQNQRLFVLIASPDNQCDYAPQHQRLSDERGRQQAGDQYLPPESSLGAPNTLRSLPSVSRMH